LSGTGCRIKGTKTDQPAGKTKFSKLIKAKDFTHLNRFPGETGNLFDILLHKAMDIEKIQGFVFFAVLLSLSFTGYPVNQWNCLLILPFFIFDWLSIYLLPKYKRSFGPIKPQVIILAILRMIPVIFLHSDIWLPLEILGCIFQIYGFWIEPFNIKVSRQQIVTPKIPAGIRYKLIHLGDLHLEHLSIREEKLTKFIQQISADAILFSGDYLGLSSIRNPQAWDELKQVLMNWKAPLGVFGVTGSPAVDLAENFPKILDGTSLRLLNEDIVILEKDGAVLQLVGLSCSHRPNLDIQRLNKILPGKYSGFRILLYHSPDIAPQINPGNIDLQLAGHTHGGQVCLPFIGPLFTGSLYGLKFKSGIYRFKNMVLYITRGIGLEGLSAPRVRFLCPPEITVWDIIGSGN
jgi:predicted MPP superfamily phosphohydrolase